MKLFDYIKNLFKPAPIQEFDIEDLDPDKRSWYYDGCGIKRRKEE